MIIDGIKLKVHSVYTNYAISKCGKVYALPRLTPHGHYRKGHWMALNRINKYGHLDVQLYIQGKIIHKLVHRLVLETFVGPCPKGMECRHLDGNPSNNNLDNLKWGTKSENTYDAVRHGTFSGLIKGDKRSNAILTDNKVRIIKYLRNIAKFSLKDVAWQFDISIQHVHNICKGYIWSHVT
ncbi:MAG: HNH endonuclease signature motif containing protein [Candidatus Bathyarchaeota archaeon]|jgi:hypothetical protein